MAKTVNTKTIFSINSEKNGLLKVVDTPYGRELLASGNAMLSCSENHKFFNTSYWGIFTNNLKKYRENYKRVLVFGLGGGVIQNHLFKNYPGIEIVTIEYDPAMNDIYKYFFSGDKFENHKILNIDAKDFVKASDKFGDYENYFDLVFVDTFSSFKVKEYDNFQNFYKLTKQFLRPNGIFAVNMIVLTDPMFVKSLNYVSDLDKFYKNTELTFVGNILGNPNLLTFSSDRITL